MSQTKVVEKLETRSLCSITFFFFFEIRVVYEIMLKNIVEQCRPLMAIWLMRIACWIPNATIRHSGCVESS